MDTRKLRYGTKLVIASHNDGKIREMSGLLNLYDIEVKAGSGYGFDDPDETDETFFGNSAIKARFFAKATNLPSLADDSGLVIPALDGAPGIYSARWAGKDKDFRIAFERIENELTKRNNEPNGAEAYFTCAVTIAWPDDHMEQFEGRISGHLTFPPRGDNGFGYDPIFIPDGYDITFAEMENSEKQKISHRGKAMKLFIDSCLCN